MKRTIVSLAVALFFFPYWWGFTYPKTCPGGCCSARPAVSSDQTKQEEKAPQKKRVARRVCGAGDCRIVWESVDVPANPVKE